MWWNWQTRYLEGVVYHVRAGSSPAICTNLVVLMGFEKFAASQILGHLKVRPGVAYAAPVLFF